MASVSFDPALGSGDRALTEASAATDWRHNRASVLADLDSTTQPAFVSAMTVLFEAYRTHSAARDWNKCAHILRILMDYPAQAMRAGPHKARQVYFQLAEHKVHAALQEVSHAPAPSLLAATVDGEQAANAALSVPALGAELAGPAPARASTSAPVLQVAPTPAVAEAPAIPQADTGKVVVDERQRALNVRRARTILRHRGPNALSRAAKALQSLPRAPINASTLAALRALHPQAVEPMGSLPAHHAAEMISVERVLGRAVKRCNNGSAPGISGWSGAHLALIFSSCTKEAVQGLHLLIRDICNGAFNGELHRRLQACCLTPLSKKNGGVRPIAIMEVFTKCAAHCRAADRGQNSISFPLHPVWSEARGRLRDRRAPSARSAAQVHHRRALGSCRAPAGLRERVQ